MVFVEGFIGSISERRMLLFLVRRLFCGGSFRNKKKVVRIVVGINIFKVLEVIVGVFVLFLLKSGERKS